MNLSPEHFLNNKVYIGSSINVYDAHEHNSLLEDRLKADEVQKYQNCPKIGQSKGFKLAQFENKKEKDRGRQTNKTLNREFGVVVVETAEF